MLWFLSQVALATPQFIPASGGWVDDSGSGTGFVLFGPPEFWRTEAEGYRGDLHWTNARLNDETPMNWAEWQLDIYEEGDYLVEWYSTPAFAVHDSTQYEVFADGTSHTIEVDQSASVSGWNTLGTYHFAAGANQFVAVYDSGTGGVSDQHIVVDAIQLTRVGCGDGTCNASDGEDCDNCEADCLQAFDIPSNGIDDDCNGLEDDDSECQGSTNRNWCVSNSVLGSCSGVARYSEIDCSDYDQICSDEISRCIDGECLNRENETWCQDDIVRTCTNGSLQETDCATRGEVCAQGECVADEEPVTEPSSDSADPDAEQNGDTGRELQKRGNSQINSGCSMGLSSSAAMMLVPLFALRLRRREEE